MLSLNTLKNTSRPRVQYRRVGRGIGSGLGKTCGRGQKGAGSRSGYKRRYGYEGGQFRLFMKLPIRGFSNARFRRALHAVNLSDIERTFEDGEQVNIETLADRGFIRGRTYGIKILGQGVLTKKVTIEVDAASASVKAALEKANIPLTVLE
jgi:large subunit ribosomal protein L15